MNISHDDAEFSSDNSAELEHDTVLIGRADIIDFNPDNILPEAAAVLNDITNWLRPTEYTRDGSEYRKHLSLRLRGTGDWVYSSAAYQQWHAEPDARILWVRGAPGSGKSVLTTSVIEKLSREECPVLYFFFRHTITANHNAKAAVRDWLAQVLKFSPPLQAELKKYMTKANDKILGVEELSLANLFRLLHTALSHLPKVYILVDALDEMDQEELEIFSQDLYELAECQPVQVKLFMTSRPVAVIEKIARTVKVLDIGLDKERVAPDITAYILHRLCSSSIPAESHSHVANTIMERCDGLFLYARLALDHVFKRPDQYLADSLRSIPTSLSVMYSNILNEQSNRDYIPVGLQQLILELVTHATRPLRLLEISDLINVTQDIQDLASSKDLIRSACGPLLQIVADETVHVGHHSLTEYLNGTTRDIGQSVYPVFEPGPTHNRLALLCMAYLQAGCLDGVIIPKKGERPVYQALPPFTRYAASNWHVHARRVVLAGHDQSEMNRKARTMLVGENLEKLGFLGGASKTCGFTPIGLATFFKLTSLAREVLDHAEDHAEGSEDAKERSLRYAVVEGDETLTNLLLEYGADAKAYNERGWSALHLAVDNKRHQIVKRLLNAGVDAFLPSGKDRVMGAENMAFGVYPGDVGMASIFLPYLDTAERANWALGLVVTCGRQDILQPLLTHSLVDVNCKFHSQTPLYIACEEHDADSIDLLLKAGADPNIVNGFGPNVLYALTRPGFTRPVPFPRIRTHYTVKRNDEANTKRCFKLVLDAGARADQHTSGSFTPLHFPRSATVVECLLDAGVDPNVTNKFGNTMMDNTTDPDILKILESRGYRKATSQLKSVAPLLTALACLELKGEEAFSLLENGADVSVVDEKGNGALHNLVANKELGERGHLLLEQLHAKGADANLKNHQGQTPLHSWLSNFSSQCKRKEAEKVLDQLLAAGADVNTNNEKGQPALFQIMEIKGHFLYPDAKIKFCQKMLAAGASLDATNSEGRNLLHCMIQPEHSSLDLIRFLVSCGMDPHQADTKGNTLWHLAVPGLVGIHHGTALIKELEKLGVDPLSTSHDGETPLHVAVKWNPTAFCSQNCECNSRFTRSYSPYSPSVFDYFLGLYHDIDIVDKGDVTPLHLASTVSEYLTRRLLELGADPRKKTREGLTPLHLALRSKQTNTLGLLLAWLKAKVSDETTLKLVNGHDCQGRSPLYYGCASGCVETVKLLLDAGAVVDTDVFTGSAWQGCGMMRAKEDLKLVFGRSKKFGSVNKRLDEIVNILVADGFASGVRYIDQAISLSIENKPDHATECLLRTRQQLDQQEEYQIDNETSARLSQRKEIPQLSEIPGPPRRKELVPVLMARRQYALAATKIRENLSNGELPARISMFNYGILHYLVAGGFADMLDQVASPEAVDAKTTRDKAPLLITACRRKDWNMDVVRLLIEKKGTDPNVRGLEELSTRDGPTALHILVRGGHWWQINQALPYLVSMGADLEARAGYGMTPLRAALEVVEGPKFSRKAVESLLQLGADPNAADCWYQTCLSRAIDNMDVYHLLVGHGAIVDPAVMMRVIDSRNLTLLQAILASGVDPNMPKHPDTPGNRLQRIDHDPSRSIEEYPLKLLSKQAIDDKRDQKATEEMLRLLLDYGANPSARYDTTTVMHRLIRDTRLVHAHILGKTKFLDILLHSSSLDIEARNSSGMTLLLSRCSTGGGLIQQLLKAGSDIRAKDDHGRTALHILVASKSNFSKRKNSDINCIFTAAPELVHAVDNEGRTPLHVALQADMNHMHIYELTEAGVDIQASVTSTANTPLHLLFRQTWIISADGDVKMENDCHDDPDPVVGDAVWT
ncbi:ankyrin [Fusarium albosuccineum]|uniref:Ankyrin n=1 Tax=Fusarium albosuccineum TaxID=1237068 RepID=A0A8H4L1Y3_9HYPO|nr:ankyrin [Fusarium albosuccineum]